MRVEVRAVAAIGPWGHDHRRIREWIDGGCIATADGLSPLDLPMVKGFIESRFITLVNHTLIACLDEATSSVFGADTGIVLATVLGDTTTADKASADVGAGKRPQPLLFYQSVPTSVLGHVSRERGITGPMICISGGQDLYQDAAETVELLLAEGRTRHVLLVYVDLGYGPRPRETLRLLTEASGQAPAAPWECCIATLLSISRSGGEGIDLATWAPDGLTHGLPRPVSQFLHLTWAAAYATREL